MFFIISLLAAVKAVYQIHFDHFGQLSILAQLGLGVLMCGAWWILWKGAAYLKRSNRAGYWAFATSCLLCALALEYFLRFVYAELPLPTSAYLRFTPNAAGNLHAKGIALKDWRQTHAGGYTLFRPNSIAFWRLGTKKDDIDFIDSFATDENGLKNPRNLYTAQARFEVMTLGDSFTEGSGTSLEDSWPQQLQKKLGVSVYNLGGGGSGPIGQRALWNELGPAKKPRLLLWGFLEGNDLEDAVREAAALKAPPASVVESQSIGQRLVRQIDSLLVLDLPFAIYRTWKYRRETMGGQGGYLEAAFSERGPEKIPFAYYEKSLADLRKDEGYSLWMKEWAALLEHARRNQMKVCLIFFPNKAHAYWPRLTPDQKKAMAAYASNLDAKRELVRDFCQTQGIPMIDLVAALHAVPDPWSYYFQVDGHMNAKGNHWVSEQVAQFIWAKKIL